MKWNENKNIVLPDYGHCILGTITSILNYYNVETKHKPSEKLDAILNKKEYRNVILFVLDGFGEAVLNQISPNGYFKEHEIDVVTSVYPSTTTAALVTYYSGRPPYETGWIGWSQYFKEYGRALDMLTHNESYYREPLTRKPLLDVYEKVVNYESVFHRIESAPSGARAYEIVPKYSERRGRHTLIGNTIDELIMHINDIVRLPERKFIMAYSDNPDGLLHNHGMASGEVKNFIISTEEKIKTMCENFDEDTLFIVSADHGHKDIEKAYTLLDYPEIQECLIMPASLESRVLTFWVKEDKRKIFEERFQKEFKDEFWLMGRDEFLDKYHMLGYGEKHRKIDDFIGNYVALSVAGSAVRLETYLAEGKPIRKSIHGGLTKEEMEVPVIAVAHP